MNIRLLQFLSLIVLIIVIVVAVGSRQQLDSEEIERYKSELIKSKQLDSEDIERYKSELLSSAKEYAIAVHDSNGKLKGFCYCNHAGLTKEGKKNLVWKAPLSSKVLPGDRVFLFREGQEGMWNIVSKLDTAEFIKAVNSEKGYIYTIPSE